MPATNEQRWRGRPILSACLRLGVFFTPIGVSVAFAWTLSRHLPHAPGAGAWAVRTAITLGSSTVVLFFTDRAARRLLPLAVLLKLGMAFPKEAPSRLAVARAAGGVRDLERRVEQARLRGVEDEPARAAVEILTLVAAVEAHDRATRGHSERVRIYTDLLAEQLKLSRSDRDRLRWAALLHDVGKLTVPGEILNKPGKLSPEEWEIVHRHPDEGARFTQPLRAWLGEWACAIEQHHERWDGEGYPRRIGGEQISLAGRIVAVADCYETMTAARAYRRPMNSTAARAELVRCSGTQFDAHIVRAFLEISVRRLSWASGPFSWVAQSPVLWGIEAAGSAGRVVSGAAAGAAAGGMLAVSAVAPPVIGPPQPRIERAAHADASPKPVVLALPGVPGEDAKPVESAEPTPGDVGEVKLEPETPPDPGTSPTAEPSEDPRKRTEATPEPEPTYSPTWSPSPWPSPTWSPAPSPSPTTDPNPSPSPTPWRPPLVVPSPSPAPSESTSPGGGGGGGTHPPRHVN